MTEKEETLKIVLLQEQFKKEIPKTDESFVGRTMVYINWLEKRLIRLIYDDDGLD